MFTLHHVSHVTYHMSGVKCKGSGVMCIFFSFFLFSWQSCRASCERVCYQKGPSPSSFKNIKSWFFFKISTQSLKGKMNPSNTLSRPPSPPPPIIGYLLARFLLTLVQPYDAPFIWSVAKKGMVSDALQKLTNYLFDISAIFYLNYFTRQIFIPI